MRRRRIGILVLLLLISGAICSQTNTAGRGYRIPLDLPVSLSGSYGELRATHFHAGIDLRVGGVVGASLFAAESGFISRISVSPTGYGLALYIQHPDGMTTLYGHMHDFAPKITRWVREQQYEKEKFAVNLYPDSTMFPVKRGEFIGRAGNSGSSGGPHLHFEVRDTETQIPLNPITEAGINVPDNIPPVISRVSFYSVSDPFTLPHTKLLASYTEPFQGVISVSDTFYVAVAATDRQNNTSAKLAVSHYNYYLNDKLIFSFAPDKIPFDQGRYINSIVEYSEKQLKGVSMIKSFVEPGGGLKQNIQAIDEGLFVLPDEEVHIVKIEVLDEHNNKSVRSFKVRKGAASAPGILSDSTLLKKGIIMPWFLPNRFEAEGIRLTLPPGALYSSILFEAEPATFNDNPAWRVHRNTTPIHNPARIALRADHIPPHLTDKAVIVTYNGNGSQSSIGGSYKNGWIETSTGSFGNFAIALDTVPPRIVPAFRDGDNLSGRAYLRITISDNLSGVADYSVKIDDKWILTAYDPKNRRLETELKADKISKGKRHTIVITVTDGRGNINTLKSSFIW